MNKILFLFAFLLTACPTNPDWPIPAPPPPLDAGAPCATSCERYRQLSCPEGEPTKKGHTCEEVCNNAAKSGNDLAGPSDCTARAQTCKAVEDCMPR